MSAKNVDRHNRFRSITVGFRVSPEENEQLNRTVALSGLPKQEYCYQKCMNRDITVTPNFARQDRMEEQQEWETALLKKIEATIRETFTSCMKEFQISAAQPTAEKSEQPTQADPPDETEANIEAFLDCF